jgi:hypothetical protein
VISLLAFGSEVLPGRVLPSNTVADKATMNYVTCGRLPVEAIHLSETLAEEFELRGVANEAVEMWTQREKKLFQLASSPEMQSSWMNPSITYMRQIALRLILTLSSSRPDEGTSMPDAPFLVVSPRVLFHSCNVV